MKIQFKKLIGCTLAGVLALGLLSSCGSNVSNNSGKSSAAATATPSKSNEATEKPSAAQSSESEKKSAEDSSSSSSNTKDKSSSENSTKAKADDKKTSNPSATPKLQTSEEAANDTTAIDNDIASLEELIENGEYDDALMSIKSLETKNLTDSQKEKIKGYRSKIEGKTSKGLID